MMLYEELIKNYKEPKEFDPYNNSLKVQPAFDPYNVDCLKNLKEQPKTNGLYEGA
jgi:hypothetical protein